MDTMKIHIHSPSSESESTNSGLGHNRNSYSSEIDDELYKVDTLPNKFTYLDLVDDSIIVDLMYKGSDNFLGRPVNGYKNSSNRAILTIQACNSLRFAQRQLKIESEESYPDQNLSLIIHDAYRPVKAVDDFMKWKDEPENLKIKKKFYPNFESKNELFSTGFIAPGKSTHSRGSTVDVSIVTLHPADPADHCAADENSQKYEQLDFGTPVDFFGRPSGTNFYGLTEKQRANRDLLLKVMDSAGFVNYPMEWWHFTLDGEPFIDKYFEFDLN